MSERIYEGWSVAFKTGHEYEADLVRDRLDDAGIPAVVLTQRDHAFNLTMGDLASVNVMVPPEHLEEARQIIESAEPSDAEMNDAAMSADPADPAAHNRSREAMLDSGIEEINLSVPDEEDENELP